MAFASPFFNRRRTRVRIVTLLLGSTLVTLLAGGCATRVLNEGGPLPDAKSGYRLAATPLPPGNTDEIFVILAFSGGGTRAAAFSYGAMEKLRDTTIRAGGNARPLLDEVDIISSVSGGSFTAAYYGLNRQRLFTDFPERFLYRKVRNALVWGMVNPLNWLRLASPTFDRIDLAAEYYHEHVFDRKTFGDLTAVRARPFIVLNATDMSYTSRFEFTQDQFDFLSSNIASYPVARGVAASSAFPILLSPLTVKNYRGFTAPGWVADALANRSASPRDYGYADVMNSYLTRGPDYVHLLDGGLGDNVGLRAPAHALASVQHAWAKPDWSLQKLRNEKIKYLVVISVNAKPGLDEPPYRGARAPGLVGVISTVANGPMGNYSDESEQYLHDSFDAWRQDIANSKTIADLRNKPERALREVKFYPIELNFQDVKDAGERARLNAIATDFQIPRADVDLLRRTAAQLLDNSEVYQQLLKDLAQERSP